MYLSPFRSIITQRRVSTAPWNASGSILLIRLSLRSSTSSLQQLPRPSTLVRLFPHNCSTRMLPSGAAAKLFRLRRELKLRSRRCTQGKMEQNNCQISCLDPMEDCLNCIARGKTSDAYSHLQQWQRHQPWSINPTQTPCCEVNFVICYKQLLHAFTEVNFSLFS